MGVCQMNRVMPMRLRIGGNGYSTLRQRLVNVPVGPLVRTRRDLVRVGRDRGVGVRIAEMDGGGISRGWGSWLADDLLKAFLSIRYPDTHGV